ncbi:PREDICTED: uncharacterized protein LOC104588121 isoform X2 [Nelumbo nucifera]|uniref:Uncharacterized protein LOC104588121 isoform X2 n=1 Tax=Nelumbo nucifera TaxID=4432 RepID=A0A1U8Q0Y8_NELNU|nr:PREDICTED: uncharacterized protein LOC104588121 isoform X2 [Nelumbo nucifera]
MEDSSNSSTYSKWVYAVFWRILPRNYPPPKWDYGEGALDRSKGNKRNWILVWEDGFCDFHECERAGSGYVKGRFGADIFFKMSHEVYSFGEGLVGKVAADNSHKWVFRENPPENDPNWSGSIEPQPKQWKLQFNSGIQTIAVISVREGIIQLGSLDKIVEDLNMVISVQRKFSYLQSIPGFFTIQRPCPAIQHPNTLKHNSHTLGVHETGFIVDDTRNLSGEKRCYGDNSFEEIPIKSVNLGWNSPQMGTAGGPFCPIPPLLPSMSWSLGALLSRLPSVLPPHTTVQAPAKALHNNSSSSSTSHQRIKTNGDGGDLAHQAEEQKPKLLNPKSSLEDEMRSETHGSGVRDREKLL